MDLHLEGGGVRGAAFNQTGSCLVVTSSSGFEVFQLDPFRTQYHRFEKGIQFCVLCFNSSLMCIAGGFDEPGVSPRKLKLWDIVRNTTLCNLVYESTVLSVKMVVVLEHQSHIYDLRMRLLHTLATVQNPSGLCALSLTSPSILAVPASTETGRVALFDTEYLRILNVFEAHDSRILALALDASGTRLATASEKGTVVRVFALPSGERLLTLRRGSTPCRIHGLCFSPDAAFLAAVSSSPTVHVFNVGASSPFSDFPDVVPPARGSAAVAGAGRASATPRQAVADWEPSPAPGRAAAGAVPGTATVRLGAGVAAEDVDAEEEKGSVPGGGVGARDASLGATAGTAEDRSNRARKAAASAGAASSSADAPWVGAEVAAAVSTAASSALAWALSWRPKTSPDAAASSAAAAPATGDAAAGSVGGNEAEAEGVGQRVPREGASRLAGLVGAVASYLPGSERIGEYMSESRCFAHVKLTAPELPHLCALRYVDVPVSLGPGSPAAGASAASADAEVADGGPAATERELRLLLLRMDGIFMQYRVPLRTGGVCALVSESLLAESESEVVGSAVHATAAT